MNPILTKFAAYCNPQKNETFERHKFFTRCQHAGESIEFFTNALRTLSKTRNFGAVTDTLIRDRLICGITDSSLRERLLRREDLTLDQVITMGRISENTSSQIKSLNSENIIEINSYTKESTDMKAVDLLRRKSNSAGNANSNFVQNCFFCKHDHSRRKCPAYGANCNKCNQKNHFIGSEACKKDRCDINTVSVDNL